MSDEKQPKVDSFPRVFDRLAELSGLSTDAAIARAFGVSPQAIANSRKKGTIPFDRVVKFAVESGFSLDYLFLGIGSTRVEHRHHGIDEDLFSRVTAAFREEGCSFKGVKLELLTDAIIAIYNNVVGLAPEEQERSIRSQVLLMDKMSLKRSLNDIKTLDYYVEGPEKDQLIESIERQLATISEELSDLKSE